MRPARPRAAVVAREIVVLDAEDLGHRLAVLAEREGAELALADRAVLQRPAVAAAQWLLARHDLRARIDDLLLLIPPDGAQIETCEVELVELDHARADQAIAEPQRRLLDLDDDDVGQQLAQFRRIEGGAQRNGMLRAAPRSPIVVEAMDAGRVELGEVEPVDLMDHGSDGAAAGRE